MADFKNLRVWQEARKLTINVIRSCEGINGNVGWLIRNQIVRAAMSVPSNIAEGSAKRSDRDFARYVRIALGSATEVESHLILANDLEVIDKQVFNSLSKQVEDVQKMLSGLERKLGD